jgi:phage gp46-like protein
MADIALVMGEFGGDVVVDGFDLARDDGLETSVVISLFTDSRASTDLIPAELPKDDLRGWWGDIGNEPGDNTGSLLWLLKREKQVANTLTRAKQYCRDALKWMTEDLVASRIEVAAVFIATGWMQITIDIYRPSGELVRYRYNYEWAAQAAKRVP